MSKRILTICSAALLMGSFIQAQEIAESKDAFVVERRQNGLVISVGEHEIHNTYLLKKVKAAGIPMYRSFMHGVGDGDATPVAWESLDDKLPLEKGGFKVALKSSELSNIVLNGGEKLALSKPVLNAEKLISLKGKSLRLFIWIKGEDTGKNADLWSGAPAVKVEIVDTDGELLSVTPSYFRTRGSFPWFCYHIDVEVPALNKVAKAEKKAATTTTEAAAEGDDLDWDALLSAGENAHKEQKRQGGLYITLSNPDSGKAYFSTLSWKVVKSSQLMASADTLSTRIDPKTNSMAPNPDYDELPMHLMLGVSSEGQWTFLKGNAAWAGIDTPEKLNAYFDTVENDWMHNVHGVSQLVSLYNNGVLLQTMPAFNDEWKAVLQKRIPAMQDGRTGMWLVNGKPSLFATHAIVSGCYSAAGIAHPGYTPAATPWRSLPEMQLHHAEAMIQAIVSQQKKVGNRKEVAGWNNYAFMADTADFADGDLACDLRATTCAVELLARAAQLTDKEATRRLAEKSIQDAWLFVMKELFLKTTPAIWKTNSNEKMPTVPGSMFAFLEATQWLDLRQNKELRFHPPVTTLDQEGNLTLKWKPEAGYASLRVFVADANKQTAELTDSNLVAIIQPKANHITKLDPYLALRLMLTDAQKHWGITPESEGAKYLAFKQASLPKKLKTFNKIDNVKLAIPLKKYSQAVHIAAVTPYGEMTQFITLPETIPAQEGAADDAEGAATVGEQPADTTEQKQ